MSALLLASLLALATPLPAVAQEVHTFDISAQDSASAIRTFSVQSGLQILASGDDLQGKRLHPVHGNVAVEDALNSLLAGTGLEHRYVSDRTVALVSAAPAESSVEQSSEQPSQKKPVQLDEVVVTGTHIRNAPTDSSQVIVYDRAAIDASGAITLEDFSRQMAENFGSVSTLALYSGVVNGTGRQESAGNSSFGAAFNIHGLGAEATLTLINGHRIASGGPAGQFVDISLIPLSAIERVEVLPDGASAIYGSDAVAGVVNIILRSDYDGAETAARYGLATRGGDQQTTASQIFGTTWRGGGGMVAYEFDKQGGLRGNQRDFVPIDYGNGLGTTQLYPEQTRHSVMLTAHQELTSQTELSADAMFSRRHYVQSVDTPLRFEDIHTVGTPEEYGVTLDLDQALPAAWHLNASPSFYKTDQPASATIFSRGAFSYDESVSARLGMWQMHLHADGPVYNLPAGAAKIAIGGEFRHETWQNDTEVAFYDYFAKADLSRSVKSGFAELQIPIVGNANAAPLVKRLELTLAGRYDSYTSGGSAFTPRVGLLWSAWEGLLVRSSFARAFVAPRLDQLLPNSQEYETDRFYDPTSSSGLTNVLVRWGGNRSLTPERSTTYTFGIEERPTSVPDFVVTGTYFNTVFRNQIAFPPSTGIDPLHDPTIRPFVNLAPDPAEVAELFATGQVADYSGFGPGGVQATFDERYANLAVSRQSGMDVSTSYSHELPLGRLGLKVSSTYLFSYQTQNTPNVPYTVLLDQLGEPVKLRANAILSWQLQGFASSLSIRYVNRYENPLFTPAKPIGSWTTADLHLGYAFPEIERGLLSGCAVALDIKNLFDRNPPHIDLLPGPGQPEFSPGFDGANADPLGRVVSLQLRKRW